MQILFQHTTPTQLCLPLQTCNPGQWHVQRQLRRHKKKEKRERNIMPELKARLCCLSRRLEDNIQHRCLHADSFRSQSLSMYLLFYWNLSWCKIQTKIKIVRKWEGKELTSNFVSAVKYKIKLQLQLYQLKRYQPFL